MMELPPPEKEGTGKARAKRFAVKMVVSYRRHLDRKRYSGITENVSRSGVLFRAEHALTPSTPIHMSLTFPDEALPGGSLEAFCNGIVTRTEFPSDGSGLPMMATTISNYRFVGRRGERCRAGWPR